MLTVDLVILTVRDELLQILLVKRGNEPYAGSASLPGGFVRELEEIDDAAIRELQEETGLDGSTLHLEQLRTYGAAGRDPRGRVVTVAYIAIAPDLPPPVAGTDARDAQWEPVVNILRGSMSLAFDHKQIVTDAIERAAAKLEYTTLAASFCPEPFTIADLRRVYEAVWSTPIDPRNFHRKVLKTDGFVVPTGGQRATPNGRPARLYARGEAVSLYPPMLRPEVA
jgi:8-oxo-dGTP diphosphatase